MTSPPLRARAWYGARRLLPPRVRAAGRAAIERLGVSPETIEHAKALAQGVDATPVAEITEVVRSWTESDRLREAGLELPAPGAARRVYDLELKGWALGRETPVAAVEVLAGERLLRRIPLGGADARAAGPAGTPRGDGPGFRSRVGLVGLPLDFALSLDAVFADDSRAPLATVRGRRTPVRSGYEPALRPLLLTSVGRSGTTWLMRLLSAHPAIVAFRNYPYEVRTGRYWLHLLATLGQPADHADSAHPGTFDRQRGWVGANPYYPDMIERSDAVDAWFGRAYVDQLAAFCQRSIDETYRRVALLQGQPAPALFAEKHHPDHLPVLAWELYPGAREVFLVRDFRDVLASVTAFNDRRGYQAFRRDGFDSDEAYVRGHLLPALSRVERSWAARSARAHLVRYEDLIAQPEPTLGALFAYLGLDHAPATVAAVLRRAGEDTPDLERHRTSDDPAASIGRWRRDLSPALQATCAEVLGDGLRTLGYDV
jgi:Sulfotransferase family